MQIYNKKNILDHTLPLQQRSVAIAAVPVAPTFMQKVSHSPHVHAYRSDSAYVVFDSKPQSSPSASSCAVTKSAALLVPLMPSCTLSLLDGNTPNKWHMRTLTCGYGGTFHMFALLPMSANERPNAACCSNSKGDYFAVGEVRQWGSH